MNATADRMRDATREFYETHSRNYAEATAFRPLSDVLTRFVGRLCSDARVLDLGCGAGHDLAAMEKVGTNAFGLDYATSIAAIAGANSGRPVVVADMRTIPFANGIFGGVWASASLLHLERSDLPAVLAEIRRILEPDGLFFASVKSGSGQFRDEDGRFFSLYREDEWLAAVTDAGFVLTALHPTPADAVQPGGRNPDGWINSLATAT